MPGYNRLAGVLGRGIVFFSIVFCGFAGAQPVARLSQPVGLGIDPAQHLVVFYRAGRKWPLLKPMAMTRIDSNTVLVMDKSDGRVLTRWGAGLFVMPHGLSVDRAGDIWVTDVGLHQVFKFSAEGKLLLTLGVAFVAGNDCAHFNRPTGVAVAADGSFYISDGYRNSRVVRFSADGHYLFSWGSRGRRPGEFHVPHGLVLDGQGNVYVADRENRRIEVFDANGRLLRVITNKAFGRICAVAFDPVSDHLIAVDDKTRLRLFHRGSEVFVLDRNGMLLKRFGRQRGTWYHDVVADAQGNIFAGDILGNRIMKFSAR